MTEDKTIGSRVSILQTVGQKFAGIYKGHDPMDKNFIMLDMGQRVRRFPRNGIEKMMRSVGTDVTHLLYPEKAAESKSSS